MRLPDSWIDALFARLSVRYGEAFLKQWPDADPALIKADWAEVLSGFDGKSIAYALDYLPPTAPNAMQFRNLCRSSPRAEAPALEAPRADPAKVAEAMASIGQKQSGRSLAQECIDNIERLIANGLRPTPAQRAMLETCRKVVGEPA